MTTSSHSPLPAANSNILLKICFDDFNITKHSLAKICCPHLQPESLISVVLGIFVLQKGIELSQDALRYTPKNHKPPPNLGFNSNFDMALLMQLILSANRRMALNHHTAK
jgi:hypothetical protein